MSVTRESKRYNYLYKITNRITNQYYIGIHSTDDLEQDQYMGSGKYIKRAIRKYGLENFSKEILGFYPSRKELSDAENRYITEEVLRDPLCYNLRTGGDRGASSTPSVEVKDRIQNTLKDKKARWMFKECSTILVPESSFENLKQQGYVLGRGKNRPHKGMVYVNNGKENKAVPPEQIEDYLSKGWVKGRLSAPNKGKITIMKDRRTKFINREELGKYLSEGWVRGKEGLHKGMLHKTKPSFEKGTREVMSKNGKYKFIPLDQVESYLDQGWIFGMKG